LIPAFLFILLVFQPAFGQKNYDIKHLDADIEINPFDKMLVGNLTYQIKILKNVDSIAFDAPGILVNKVKVACYKVKYQMSDKYLIINKVFKKGKVYQEIGKTARQLKADIIFTGTHGVTGFEQYWIGSNAYRIMTSAPCPVITVRGDYHFEKSIGTILLPLDSSLETKQKLPFTVELAKRFNAAIHLLKVYNSPIGVIRKRIDSFGREAEKCINDKNIKYKIESVEAVNVAASILEYVDNNGIDLIAIMTEQNITTANKFLGPYAQQLINGAKVPVLSLRDKEYH